MTKRTKAADVPASRETMIETLDVWVAANERNIAVARIVKQMIDLREALKATRW
jgi:hypothetical protein